jgi:hypothetical protein
MKRQTVEHPRRWQKARFGHLVVSDAPPEWHRCYQHAGAYNTTQNIAFKN